MAYTPNADTFRIISAAHGATAFVDPIDWSYDGETETVASRPGTNLSPTVALDSIGMKAMVKTSQPQTPIVPGVKASLVIVLACFDGSGTKTLTFTNMIALDPHGSGSSKPHNFEQHFIWSNAGTEATGNLTIS